MDTRTTRCDIVVVVWINRQDPDNLERRLTASVQRWGLTLGARPAGGFRSALWECTARSDVEAVLKLTVTAEEALLEARALECWRETGGSVRLLDFEPGYGALLLERLRPATPLPSGDDLTAVEVAMDLLGRLYRVGAVDGFPTLKELFPNLAEHSRYDLDYERETRDEPMRAEAAEELMQAACRAADQLCATATSSVLLHGDFLDKNLLLNGGRYVAVDPIPRLGEPESEIGFFACHHPPVDGIVERADVLSERLGADNTRAARWAAVWVVLLATSAWRPDQEALERLVGSAGLRDLLAG
jgi:streptomycin 6-kinase